MLNEELLFTDGTPFYCTYIETEHSYDVCLRVRTGADEAVSVHVRTQDGTYPMIKEMSRDGLDYYKICLKDCKSGESYDFEVSDGENSWFLNKRGVMREENPFYNFIFIPGFETPEWARGAVFYQIYTDRFCNGNPDNDVLDNEYRYIDAPSVQVKDWNAYPEAMDVGRFYGGDLEGILSKLDYLEELGVEVLYLNPIFVSPSNHKYDIQDYDYVDPHFGVIVEDEGACLLENAKDNTQAERFICRVTNKKNLEASNACLVKLIEAAHERGMKVILDGVFNHCGSFNKWMDRERIYEHQPGYAPGAYVDEQSPYHDFFQFFEDGSWPYNAHYDGWWGHDTLPKLNYEGSKTLEDYILRIAAKWVSPPFNADGWRLDVAADLGHSPEYNHAFWKKFRTAVKTANPQAIILAEHYGDPAAWLQGDEWDTVMNYDAFMEPVTWFLTGMEKHSDNFRGDLLGNDVVFRDAMSHHMSRMHTPSLYVAMNELSNHDHSRFLTRTNHKVGRVAQLGSQAAKEDVDEAVMRMAVVMQMTWPGAPTLYYGDEAGVCGFTDPDSRRTYPWGRENQALLQFHKDTIDMHKIHPVFQEGSLRYLYGFRNLVCYTRFMMDVQAIVIVHIGDVTVETAIPVKASGAKEGSIFRVLMLTDEQGYRLDGPYHVVRDGKIFVEMPAKSAMVLLSHEEDYLTTDPLSPED